MKKVLMVSAYIPHYREDLIIGLSEKCDLTVTSMDVEKLNLLPPKEELLKKCNLVKTKNIKLFEKFLKIVIIPKELKLLFSHHWDVVFAFYSIRYPHRLIAFYLTKLFNRKVKWYWVGHIYGKNNSRIARKLRKITLNLSDGVLTYTDEYVTRLIEDGVSVPIKSFNNTHVKFNEVEQLPFNFTSNEINLVFVGRYQPRKKIERLIELAYRRQDVYVKLIGPGMEVMEEEISKRKLKDRVEIVGPKVGKELIPYLKWAHVVANPGHVGLIVLTAGQYGRPIIINNTCEHAPEYIVAKKSNQYFIDWGDDSEVDNILNKFIQNRMHIIEKGTELCELVKAEYIVDVSVDAFASFLK